MNSIGRIFRIFIFGESHGVGVGILIDGVPPGIKLTVEDFLPDLNRRKPGAAGTTPRVEADLPNLMSGVFNDFTTGAPLMVFFENSNVKSKDYDAIRLTPRPGHADFTAYKKFNGYNDYRGGGHFSGRLTTALVAAGVIAKKIIEPVSINAELIEAGGSADIEAEIEKALAEGDSIGGLVECRAENLPLGLGEPFFDSVESVIAHIAFAIPAIKGIEFGSGFAAAAMKGSNHNDEILDETGKTATNNAGGINGGITNGNPLVFRLAVKPPSSIKKEQNTIDISTGKQANIKVEGRHDACIARRVPVVAEAAAAIALADLLMLNKAIQTPAW